MASISSVTFNPHNLKQKASQFCLDFFGGRNKTFTVSNTKSIDRINWIGEKISSPENRLILGATALLSQPFIDASNKKVDSETKKYSICRTIAKIVVGTATGVVIRKACIKSIDAFTKLPEEIPKNAKFRKLRSCLLPPVKAAATEMTNYKNALGTFIALLVMTFSNFLIDAPLTKSMTNALVKGVNKHEK